MSTQSIYSKSIRTVREEAETELLLQAKNFLLKKRFMLGEGVDKKKRNHALMVDSFICSENCEILFSLGIEIKRH